MLRASTAAAISAIVVRDSSSSQSLNRGRSRLAQNRQDMRANRTGRARGRPMLGEEIAALQRGEHIAQRDVAGRPRQFETAPWTEPSADQPRTLSSARRGDAPRPGWYWRYPPHPPNAGPCLDWRRERSTDERQRQIGCSFPSLTLRTPRDDLAKPAPRPTTSPLKNERKVNATSDRTAAQASRTLAVAQPAAGLEPRAAADEAQAAQRLLAPGFMDNRRRFSLF